MAFLNVLLFSIFFALVIAANGVCEEDWDINVDICRSEDSVSDLKLEIEELKSKISSLESTMSDKARELKIKNEKISQLEIVIQEKTASVLSLRKEVKLLQKKGALDATELVGKVRARSNELEKKVEELKNEIEMQNREKLALESQTVEAEKKVKELELMLRTLEKMNDEQKQSIQRAERALQIAEEELVRARWEATSKLQELNEVHRAWLPPWLASRIAHIQEIMTYNWKEHRKPTLSLLVLKVSEKLGQAQKWAEPHLETAKVKWIPVVKARWIAFTASVRPHMGKAVTKAIEIFESCRSTAKPHVFALQEEVRTFVKLYAELASTITKPYVDKASSVLEPYTIMVADGYMMLLETTGTYHHQAQDIVLKSLEKHDLTKPLATKEFVWFAASASLAIPLLLIYKVLSKLFGKKVVKPARSSRSHHHHRRHKRRHADQ